MILQSAKDLSTIPSRIVSLVPSQTELLHFLGLEKETVGITKFCVHPKEWMRSKTIVGGTKRVHIDRVKNLHPQLIIANKEENVKAEVEELAKHYPVWVSDVNNLNGALQMIRDIGRLTGKIEKAEQLLVDINIGFLNFAAKMPALPAAYLVWKDPFMTVGGDTFINDMLKISGLQNVFATKTRYPQIDLQDLKDAGCKILLLSTEPYPFRQLHVESLQELLPGIQVRLADGEMFSWYGSRLLLAPRYFTSLLNQLHA